MKINQINPGRADAVTGNTPKKVDKAPADKPDAVNEVDSVHISSLSMGVQSTDASRETINTAKVEEIKQAISEGRFKVNPEVVADRLLETVKELIQNKK
ncbi:flagellar biosynthesis anti-sigma factor FlgM [uncultured Nitrosomonas sp.]|uniref:flagellar biosynthesis anti-sigma factor FlgM n=1 Tax=uncultured Nitrosomonas sp. TaxID=156424 RepID=UPI0026399672|nr:flagellar biosynthesis anti-sigma factor FlgM [uncultured Nitrosomonas sp.]